MDDRTSTAFAGLPAAASPCTSPLRLCELTVGKPDKLGHQVKDILWLGTNYTVYRSEKGVYVQFSDDPKEEADQRKRFASICPELCELRYLTYQMRPIWYPSLRSKIDRDPSSLYDHNLAQALMLVMEEDIEGGKALAQQALKMAVQRATNDNTIRYFRSALIWAAAVSVVAGLLLHSSVSQGFSPYIVAALFGVTGALLSIATRLESFELRPCNQSNMNYWMSGARLGIGIIAGVVLLLLAPTILSEAMKQLIPRMTSEGETAWQTAAVFGFIGGFAERLIPNLLQQTAEKMENSLGTPVQALRKAASDRNAADGHSAADGRAASEPA